MHRLLKAGLLFLLGTGLAVGPVSTGAEARPPAFEPGAPGIGDDYFPLDGNGGYDARHYTLDLGYDPASDVLTGVATIRAKATQDLSQFNLDLDGLEVRGIEVDGRDVAFRRDGQELTVVPSRGIRDGARFTTVVRYDGVPRTLDDEFGFSGFFHTDDGAVVAGQPHVAATWYPVNDHPSDKAAYTFHITAPTGLDVLANGELVRQRQRGDATRWTWDARQPMASYLTTMAVGDFDVDAYREGRLKYWDAIHEDLIDEPASGEQFAVSQAAESAYKRLSRTIAVPAGGATVSFQVDHQTNFGWDFFLVEAHTPGQDDWTTLPDTNGHTSRDTGGACFFGIQDLHPFLVRYQTLDATSTCIPEGTTGEWWAASGRSDGYETWTVDLARYAGGSVELSLSYVSFVTVQAPGVFVDDVVVSTGEGSTSFEADDDPLDGWTVPGPPEGSPGNENDWVAGTADVAVTTGDIARGSLDRQPEIIGFLADVFGRYPFRSAGGIVPDEERLGFALETQTRPVYSQLFFSDPISGDSVVVHELAHQWFGDSLALERWRDIWLNEGFATYAEWLWSEREGLDTAQELFDFGAGIPADNPFWSVVIGDPGPSQLFDRAVYNRGAMTLHALRLQVGDEAFFRTVRWWAALKSGRNVATEEFVALAERVSRQDLDAFFTTWLYTPEKPAGLGDGVAAGAQGQTPAEPESAIGKRFVDGRNRG
jgi:hypothetical protein